LTTGVKPLRNAHSAGVLEKHYNISYLTATSSPSASSPGGVLPGTRSPLLHENSAARTPRLDDYAALMTPVEVSSATETKRDYRYNVLHPTFFFPIAVYMACPLKHDPPRGAGLDPTRAITRAFWDMTTNAYDHASLSSLMTLTSPMVLTMPPLNRRTIIRSFISC
jgi:hypothetical protein